MRRRLIALAVLVMAGMPSWCLGFEAPEPRVYVIQKGDTLWGLSERFIKDPQYWPSMWSQNRMITNPHVIYPGGTVRVFPDRLELIEPAAAIPVAPPEKAAVIAAPVAVPPVETEAVSDVTPERTFMVRGYEGFLREKGFRPAGLIIGIQHDRVVAADDDIVYTDIGTDLGAKGGEKFSVYRTEGTVSHPITNEIMGSKVVSLGLVQLTDLEKKASRAIITKSYQEMSPGSSLELSHETYPKEIPLKMTTASLSGYIIETGTGAGIIAAGDIVFVDVGANQGAEPGNMLYVVRDVTLDQRYVEGRVETLPQELLGAVVILETGKRTATALVVKSIDAIYKGDRILSLMQ